MENDSKAQVHITGGTELTRPPYPDGVAFIDFDGCISICNWRNELLPDRADMKGQGRTRKTFDDFHAASPYDPPNQWMIRMMEAMYQDGVKVIILTGRMEQNREQSEEWLAKHGVQYDRIHMRANNDYRSSEVFKAEYIAKYYKEEVRMIFDDREKIINHLKALGYPTFKVEATV
jgi:hypothetical protein